jgi:hypothetical protein
MPPLNFYRQGESHLLHRSEIHGNFGSTVITSSNSHCERDNEIGVALPFVPPAIESWNERWRLMKAEQTTFTDTQFPDSLETTS